VFGESDRAGVEEGEAITRGYRSFGQNLQSLFLV